MERQEWVRLKEVFHEICDLEREEQQLRLDAVCASDHSLRNMVEQLLAFDRDPGGILAGGGGAPTMPNSVFSPGEVIASRFEILGFLGKGGMGEVYRAHDRHLGCNVALKTILPGLADLASVQKRFKREIRIARQIGHKNICQTYDLVPDTAEPPRYLLFSMELLEGETLAEYLKRKGRLRFGDALPLIRQMVAGLSALHEEGIVHRDFKPANVFLVSGRSGGLQVKITDFGLACPVSGAESGGVTVSGSGEVVGTPRYMAPEQLNGRTATPAADTYALGIVMYEMATGGRAYTAETIGENAVQKQAPPLPPSRQVKDLPPQWEDAILRCVQPHEADRPGDVRDVAAALPETGKSSLLLGFRMWVERVAAKMQARWLVPAAVGLLLALALEIAGILPHRWVHEGVLTEKHVAVIPFRNVTGSSEGQSFCDGLEEMIPSELSRLQHFQDHLLVVPASEIRANNVIGIREAKREFGINIAITGSVQQLRDGVRVTVNLVNAETERQLQGKRVTVTFDDLGSAQDQIVAHVSAMLELQISAQAAQVLRAARSDSRRASTLYWQVRPKLKDFGEEGNLQAAIEVFTEALLLDENYAPARAGLAEAQLRMFSQTGELGLFEKAKSNAERAVLASNGLLAEPLVTLGMVHREAGNLEEAIQDFKRALRANPYDADAHRELANTLRDYGRPEEAEEAYFRSLPEDWRFHHSRGFFYYKNGRYEEAESEFRRVVALAPNSNRGHRNLGGMYTDLGRYREAHAELQKALTIQPTAKIYDNIASCFIYEERYEEAVEAIQKGMRLAPPTYVSWANLGDALQGIPGRESEAIDAYRKAIEMGGKLLLMKPNNGTLIAQLATYEAKSGSCPQAMQRLPQIPSHDRDTMLVKAKTAIAYELCGRRQEALAAVSSALRIGYPIAAIENDPSLARLRADSRYADVVEIANEPRADKPVKR